MTGVSAFIVTIHMKASHDTLLFKQKKGHCTSVENQSSYRLFFCRKRETFECASNMKPVVSVCVWGGGAVSCLTVWFHGHQEAALPLFIMISTITQHTFHIDRHLPAECPAKPLSFFFSDTLFGSSGRNGHVSVTWLGLCGYNPEFEHNKMVRS